MAVESYCQECVGLLVPCECIFQFQDTPKGTSSDGLEGWHACQNAVSSSRHWQLQTAIALLPTWHMVVAIRAFSVSCHLTLAGTSHNLCLLLPTGMSRCEAAPVQQRALEAAGRTRCALVSHRGTAGGVCGCCQGQCGDSRCRSTGRLQERS